MLEINNRFVDRGDLIYELGDEFLVVCPKCSGKAKVFPVEISSEKINNKLFAPHRFVCVICAHRKDWKAGQISIGGNFDWYFRLPLWLQISCCGEILWAYNLRHLEILEKYVSAKLRERTKKRKKFVSEQTAGLDKIDEKPPRSSKSNRQTKRKSRWKKLKKLKFSRKSNQPI